MKDSRPPLKNSPFSPAGSLDVGRKLARAPTHPNAIAFPTRDSAPGSVTGRATTPDDHGLLLVATPVSVPPCKTFDAVFKRKVCVR